MPHYLNTLKQLGFKDLPSQHKGKGRVSSLSSISRQLFKTHYDGYHPRMSRHLATALKRYINTRPKHERKTAEFVGEIRRKLLCLHEYNVQIAKVKFKYPRSEQLDALLVQYVELECGLLYDSYKEVDEQYENNVKLRVLRLLKVILYDAFHNSEVPLKTTIKACDKALLKLFASVRADCVTENNLVASVIMKLLEKLSLLEEVNQLKGKNIPFYQDTFLRDPLVSTIRQNLATSDYESDIDNDSDEEIDAIPVVNDDIFKFSTSRSYEPRSQFSNIANRETYTSSRITKPSQFLKNFEPPRIKFGKEESLFSNSYKFNQNNQYTLSNIFSSTNSEESYHVGRELASIDDSSSIKMAEETSSGKNLEDFLNNRLTQINHEDKAVRTPELVSQAQEISNNQCESFSKNCGSNDLINKLRTESTPNSDHFQENGPTLSITTETDESQNIPNLINEEDESHRTVSLEETSLVHEFNSTECNLAKEDQEKHNEPILEVAQVETAQFSQEISEDKTNSQQTELSGITNNSSVSTAAVNPVGEVFENIHFETFEPIVEDCRDDNKQKPNSALEEIDTTEAPKNVLLDYAESTVSDENIHIHTEMENAINEQGTNLHNHRSNATVEAVNEVKSAAVEEIIDLVEETDNASASEDMAIDLESLPDTNGLISTKTSVSERMCNGLLTIEILDDDDDDGADYTFINRSKKEGQPPFNLDNTSANLLQSNEIKLEENEENHSPNFSIPSSDKSDQNFLNSNNKDSRNSDATDFSKLKNNSTSGSVKELEIVISDSEDEILDVQEKDDGPLSKSDSVPTETLEKTDCSTVTDEDLGTDKFFTDPEEVAVQSEENQKQADGVIENINFNTSNATEAIVTLVDNDAGSTDERNFEDLKKNNEPELLEAIIITSEAAPTRDVEAENSHCLELISITQEPQVESSKNVENSSSQDEEQLIGEVAGDFVLISDEPKIQALEECNTTQAVTEELDENRTEIPEIQTITRLEQHQETTDEVSTVEACETNMNGQIDLPETAELVTEELKKEVHIVETVSTRQNEQLGIDETSKTLSEFVSDQQNNRLTIVDETFEEIPIDTDKAPDQPRKPTEIIVEQNDLVTIIGETSKEAFVEVTADEIPEEFTEPTEEQQYNQLAGVDETLDHQDDLVVADETPEKPTATIDKTLEATVAEQQNDRIFTDETPEKPVDPTEEHQNDHLPKIDETFEASILAASEQKNDDVVNIETPEKLTETSDEQQIAHLVTVEEISEAHIEMANERKNDNVLIDETLEKPVESTKEQQNDSSATVDETSEAYFETINEQCNDETSEKPLEVSSEQENDRLAAVDENSEAYFETINEQRNDETFEKPLEVCSEQKNDRLATVDEIVETSCGQQNGHFVTVDDTCEIVTETANQQPNDYSVVDKKSETSELTTIEQTNVSLLAVETREISVENINEVYEPCNTDPLTSQTTTIDSAKTIIEEKHTEVLNTKISIEFGSEHQYITEVPKPVTETLADHQNTEMDIPEITNDSVCPRNENGLVTHEAVNNLGAIIETTSTEYENQNTYSGCEVVASEALTSENGKQTAAYESSNNLNVVTEVAVAIAITQASHVLSEQPHDFTANVPTGPCLKPAIENLETFEKTDDSLQVIDYSTTAQYAPENPVSAGYSSAYCIPEDIPQMYDAEQPVAQEILMDLTVHNESQSQKDTAVVALQDTTTPSVLQDNNVPREVENTPLKSFYYKSNISSTLSEVEYVEYSSEKKVNGDLELLANIAADQETLAVKTDSEKEVVDTASDTENDLKILDISNSTPKRRKSKVRLDYRKKILSRETLPRAVKQFQRKHPVKTKPDAEETDNKRVTRNRANKPKVELVIPKESPKQLRINRSCDTKYKPHDFISMENPTLPPPTNNVYAQKRLMDANTTSEDSNDSCESTLFIDLSDSGKTAEKTIRSIYEEETISDMLEFVNTEEKAPICISIPENEENAFSDSFQILKQMEDFVDDSKSKPVMSKIEKISKVEKIPNTEQVTENIEPLIINTAYKCSDHTPEDLTVEKSTLPPVNEDKMETKIVKTTDHSIENILNKVPQGTVDLKATALHCECSKNETNQAVSCEPEKLLPSKTETPGNNVIIVENTLTPSEKEIDSVPLEKQAPSITPSNNPVVATTKEPENLPISKPPVPKVKNEDSCEKTFKTKAAVKAYEDKIQPNPYVLLQNCVKPEVFSNTTGVRTRLRSKSSEQPQHDTSNRNRSSSVDSHAKTSLNGESEDLQNLKKSKANSIDKNTCNASPVVINIDEKKIETFEGDANTENVDKSTEASQILLPPETVVPVVPISGKYVTVAVPLGDKEVELVDSENVKPVLVDTVRNEQLPSDDKSTLIENDKLTVTNSTISEEKAAPNAEDTTFVELCTPQEVIICREVPNFQEDTTVPEAVVAAVKNTNSKNQESLKKKEEKASTKESVAVVTSPPKTLKSPEKVNTDKTTKFGQEKGRSLENTIKNLKEKIVESEKAKKERVSSKSPIGKNVPPRTDGTQPNKEKDDEKKHDKAPSKSAHSEDIKEKSHEGNKKDTHNRKRRSRSSSKSRTSDKKADQIVEKDKSDHKENGSRSSSKPRSVDKHSRHSDGESDRKRRSNSRSVDDKDKKNKLSDQEDANGHKRRSRSSSKSKSLERKSKQDSSSSKSKSDSKDKQNSTDSSKDNKKRSSKSPSRSVSNEVKVKQNHSEKRNDPNKEKVKDKVEETKEAKAKANNNLSKMESKNKIKNDEKSPQLIKDKMIGENIEKHTKDKETDEKSSRSKKSHKSKESKSRESSSIKSTEHKEKKNDEKENDKDKHRDAHKTKKDSANFQESKASLEKRNNEKHSEINKNDERAKSDKSRRSHSKEKLKTENVSRSDKREKAASKSKDVDKKSSHEERKESGVSNSKDKQKEAKKVGDHFKEQKENVRSSYKPKDNNKLNDHNEERKENSSSTGNVPLCQDIKAQTKNDEFARVSGEEHSVVHKGKPKVDIPKKRKYEFHEENGTNSSKAEPVPEPKIPKLHLEFPEQTVDVPKQLEQPQPVVKENELQQKSSELQPVVKESELQQKSSELKTADDMLTKDGLQNGTNELPTSEINEDNVISLTTSKDSSENAKTVDLSYENFTSGVQAAVKIQENEEVDVVPTSLPPPVPSTISEKAIEQLVQNESTQDFVCNDTSTSQQLSVSEDCNLKLQEVEKVTEVIAPPAILLDASIPVIPSSDAAYVSTAFSTAAVTLGMQVLPNTIDSTVKDFTVQATDLPLIPNVHPTSTIAGGIVTTCDLTRPITVQSTPSCSTASLQEKNFLFTFNDGETDNRENLNTTDLFDASLGLEDISPTKLPIGSNPSLDLISPSTSIAEISNSMNLVQTLGTSTINFINDVPDNSEIDIQQPNKQSSFGSNFARGTRVTEIRCFVEKESTADHNYTLGDPLLGGNNEDKNILTTGLSLSNSPEEFQLNESHLDELAFNENNFIEENGTLEDLGLLLPCKKEKPDFDNIIDDAIPKPEDIQNSIKRLNMLVDISQSGQQKMISVDNTIDHTSNTDCSVSSLGIDYAVNKLLVLGGGEVTSQNTSFSTIPDIENMNIMESSVPPPMLNSSKEHLEEPTPVKNQDEASSIAAICTSYANFMPADTNQKVVVEPVEQCPITSLDQLKKDYINETCEIMERSKPMNKPNRETSVGKSSTYKANTFATFLQSVKRDANKNDNAKVKDEIENYTIRRHNRTPVFPPKKKNATQQHHTKSPPQIKKTEILSFENNVSDSKSHVKADTSRSSEAANECRIRVKTDLIKPTESKSLVSDLSHLDYINENDQNIASEVVLPFSRPSPSEKVNLVDVPEKKSVEINPKIDTGTVKPVKHARFDKSGNDYIMENIINAHSDSKNRKNPVPDIKTTEKRIENVLDIGRKRKSTSNELSDTSDSEKSIKRGDKRQKKSDDESDKVRVSTERTKPHTKKFHDTSVQNESKSQSTDDIFDKLRETPVNKLFAQRMAEQQSAIAKNETSQTNISPEVSKSRGYNTVSENYRKDRISQSQPTAGQLYESARYRDSSRHPHSETDKRRDQRKPGYYTSNYNAPPDRRYPDKRPNSTVGVADTSPKRFIRNSSHPYSSKSDPCTSRDHPYKPRDRRSSTEQLNNLLPIKSEGGNAQEDKFSWIEKFSGSGLFDTPTDLFTSPGTTREDPSSRK